MQPIQSTNYICILPTDTLGEISSHLQKEALGRLSSVSQFFNTCEISNLQWKNLAEKELPMVYKNLPQALLKEKFKCYHNFLKEKVNLVLENASQRGNSIDAKGLLFSENLINQLNNKDLSLGEKYEAIKSNPELITSMYNLYTHLAYPHVMFFEGPEMIDARLNAFELLLKLVDVNALDKGNECPLLFRAMGGGKIELAKKLIDAGADFNRESIENYLEGDPNSDRISEESLAEIADYVAQKQLTAINFV